MIYYIYGRQIQVAVVVVNARLEYESAMAQQLPSEWHIGAEG